MSATMNLAEKVLAVVGADEFSDPIARAVGSQPANHNGQLSWFEVDLRDWGLFYGIAVGLARTEEPCEPIKSVADRALEAATDAFGRYTAGEMFRDRMLKFDANKVS